MLDLIIRNYDEHKLLDMALLNNDQIDDVLHCITMVANPSQYKIRTKLTKEFINRMALYTNIILYIVEIAYNDDKFTMTDPNNKHHLQLRVNSAPLWHKENAINVGIKKLLPSNWKAVAWIDADIEFENVHWVSDALKLLNGFADIVQLMSYAINLDKYGAPTTVCEGMCYNYYKYKLNNIKRKIKTRLHTGYAFACTRKCYDAIGGLYQYSILGSGDRDFIWPLLISTNLFSQIINSPEKIDPQSNFCVKSKGHLASIGEYHKKRGPLRVAYVPGNIRHYFHGNFENRKYAERSKILEDYNYDPIKHLTLNEDGILIPSADCPQGMLNKIKSYFDERNEDE